MPTLKPTLLQMASFLRDAIDAMNTEAFDLPSTSEYGRWLSSLPDAFLPGVLHGALYLQSVYRNWSPQTVNAVADRFGLGEYQGPDLLWNAQNSPGLTDLERIYDISLHCYPGIFNLLSLLARKRNHHGTDLDFSTRWPDQTPVPSAVATRVLDLYISDEFHGLFFHPEYLAEHRREFDSLVAALANHFCQDDAPMPEIELDPGMVERIPAPANLLFPVVIVHDPATSGKIRGSASFLVFRDERQDQTATEVRVVAFGSRAGQAAFPFATDAEGDVRAATIIGAVCVRGERETTLLRMNHYDDAGRLLHQAIRSPSQVYATHSINEVGTARLH